MYSSNGVDYLINERVKNMMHYRILKCEGVLTTWYEVQKRIFGFFWVDLYWNWLEEYERPAKFKTFDKAVEAINMYKCQTKKTVIYEEQ